MTGSWQNLYINHFMFKTIQGLGVYVFLYCQWCGDVAGIILDVLIKYLLYIICMLYYHNSGNNCNFLLRAVCILLCH
jgi:hypothetical protein